MPEYLKAPHWGLEDDAYMASADWYTSAMQSAAVCLVQKLLGAKEAGVLGG